MVRRRSGRRANATTAKCPTINLISDESDANDSLDAVSCSSAGTATDAKGTDPINPYNLSPSKLEGLVSEKSLYVKVVDIQKSNSKIISGLNLNISSIKHDDNSPVKVQSEQSGENSVKCVNIGGNLSSNRSKTVSVLSRVVTRSRRLTDNNNAVVDKVTTVGVIKSTRRTNKNAVKQKTVISDSIDEPTTDSSQSRDTESVSEKNVDVLKTGSQTDDDDPCLSGDIMYEQIIIEDDTEESINAVIVGHNPLMDIEHDFCSRPSSTSDQNCSSSSEYSKEVGSIQVSDDSKVSSSSSINDNISSVKNIVESIEINNVPAESNSSVNVNVSMTESQNIKALSSLKLDPGVEPVSSSKTESYFEPIFSIEDNSCGQAVMEVDLEEAEIKVIEIGDAVEENVCDNEAILSKASPIAKETIVEVSTNIVNSKKASSNNVSFEKIVTRSRSGVNSSRPSSVTSSPTSSIKGKTKKKKSEIKDIDVTEMNSIDSSTKNIDNDYVEIAIDKKPSTDNTKEPNTVLSDTNDSDTPLVVNRCITDETRKYMGPKGIIKNNYCSNVELDDSMKLDASSNSSILEIVNSSTSPADTEFSGNRSTEMPDNITLPNSTDKNVPMSPKELFLKNYSSQLNLEKNSDDPNDEAGELESIVNENPVKSEEIFTKEFTLKNNSVDDVSDNFPSPINKSSTVSMSKTPLKTLEMVEQSVRRSRRSSADKAKRFISSLSASPKEKKENATNKFQNSLDSNSLTEKSEKNNHAHEKQDSSVRTAEKLTPGKSPKPKPLDKAKKELVTMSSILNEKLKPMSPKELIKKSFIANEFRTMDPPSSDLIPERNSFKSYPNQASTDDNGNDVDKEKMSSSVVSFSTEQVFSDLNDSKKNEFVIDKGKYDLKADSSVSNSSLLSFDSDKPVKVKSRWRRTSELEMGKMVHSEPMDVDSSSRLSFSEDSKSETDVKPTLTPEEEKLNNEAIVAQRMNSFIHIDSNEYLTERYISKETKRMVCDCTVTKEEIAKGEKGCGEDCLNRLLLIECGSRCPLGKLCSNKCFVNRDYTKCKVLNMANKGMGVISAENIPSDRFIMEYVGEVLDPKEFRKRAKEYSKEKIAHFYFMSLKADTVIDATHKGNISRFINHSCDPNAETQKWTVNGELRIGFFSKRPIADGEEITFDYQLERYGKEAQKCYCGSSNCRGWLGENPDNDESEESSSEESSDSSEEEMEEDVKVDKDKLEYQENKAATNKIKKDKKKLPVRRKEIRDTTFNPDGDLEDEIDKLTVTGVKNQKHTLDLCRLIVRATEERSRSRLLDLIKMAATPCLRLFLDYHGLNLLWSWMVDPRSSIKIKSMIMETLFVLPIQNKTMLKDSKVLSIIEKWASFNDTKNSSDNKERGSTEEENSNSPREEGDDMKSKTYEKENRIQDKIEDFNNLDKVNDSMSSEVKIDSEIEPLGGRPSIENQASKLLEDWGNLKEEFRIPRKQRVEQMKEHERQADMEYSDPRENQSYNRRRFRDRKESRFDKVRESRFDSKKEDWNQWQNQQIGKMSKAERRQLFAERVKREEREKREAEDLWKSHQEQCQALGVNPSQTAMFHPQLNALAFYHKESNCWMPYQEGAESYGGGDGGVVVDHHQPPPHYQIDYQSHLPPGGPGYYQQGYQPPFGQFNQALLFQPPPPPPPQQFNVPPLQQHPSQNLPPPHYQQSPLPQGQALLQQGYILPPGPPLIQQGPPLLPQHGPPIPPLHGPPLSLQHCPPLPPQHGPPIPPPHGPPIPSSLPPQHCPLPPQSVPPLQPPQQGVSLPLPGHPNFFQGPPLQGPPPQQGLPPHPTVLSQTSPSPHLSLPGTPLPQVHPLPPQGAPPLPPQVLNIQSSSQQGVFSQEPRNSMEVQVYPKEQLQLSSVPLKLPPKWKTAKDKEGRLYYYHVKKRVSQWIFPYAAAAAAFNSEPTSDSSSDDSSLSSSEEEEDEEEEEEEDSSEIEQENTAPTIVQNDTEEIEQEVDGAVIKKRKSKKDDIDSPVPAKKPKESSLVSTIIIPREEAAEMIGITKKKIRDNKEKVKREKARAARKQRQQTALQAQGIDYSSASVSSKCEADTSSGPKRKIKDIFMLKMANVVVASLNQYRKHDCKLGRITSTKDFKALAKKLTHFIMVKELRHCVNVEDLDCNENVKHKARDFIRKYMSKFGPVYVNPKED